MRIATWAIVNLAQPTAAARNSEKLQKKDLR
jgi:hypothetical protein